MAMASTCLGSSICRTKTTYLAGLIRCSATPPLTQEPSRRSANYQPNSWDYDSLESLKFSTSKDEVVLASSCEKLKSEVRDLIFKETEPSSRLQLVDALQRLGIAYQFEEEIKHILSAIYVDHNSGKLSLKDDDVQSIALLFRLLRENGFAVSPDLLTCLKDDKGDFKPSMMKDINALVSLYEASFLAYEGEPILDDARSFASKNLKELEPAMDPYLRSRVTGTLDLPLHWRASRLETRRSIDQYARDGSMKAAVLQLAQVDFNSVQSVHQAELTRLSRWWKDVGLGDNLSFSRDRLMECFHYATGVVYKSHLGTPRVALTKILPLVVHLDDVYDVYGTLDELVRFTHAIGRWEMKALDTLPDYMHAIYATILKTSNDMADEILQEQCWDAHHLFKKAWHDLCQAFLNEAKWHHNGYMPSLKEYLDNGWMSSSAPLMLLLTFPFLREKVTPQGLEELESYPRLIQAPSMLLRLCNDLATHSAEMKRGDAPSSISIYMHENNTSEDVSREAIRELTIKTWKVINKEMFECSLLPPSFIEACINLGRMSHCLYHNGDGLGAPDEEKKRQITTLFLEPVSLAHDITRGTQSRLCHNKNLN